MKLQDRFEAEKLELSYADLHHEITKEEEVENFNSPNSNASKEVVRDEELVKYELDLPSYLEKGKSVKNSERAFHVGVLDWGRLEKWQKNSNKQPIIMHHRTRRYSTSSSSVCSPFSTEGSSSHSSRGRSCSPVQSPRGHPPSHLLQVEPRNKRDGRTTTAFCSNNKTEIQECNRRAVQEKVLLKPSHSDANTKLRSSGVKSFPMIPRSCQLPHDSNTLPRQGPPARAAVNPCRDKIQEIKSCNVQPKNIEKARSTSPFRHLGKIVKSYSSKEKSDSIPGPSNDSDKVRSRSSPLRRFLDPILKPKTDETCKKKSSVSVDEDRKLSRERLDSPAKVGSTGSTSTVQALLRLAYKNGLPLFTFAVEKDGDILAATVKNCSSFVKKGSIYTFFMIRETKKKSSSSWMSRGGKGRQDYVPNVVAQMNVSDTCSSDVWLREFVMFSVDTRRPSPPLLNLDYHPNNELVAIVTQLEEPNKTSTKDIDCDSVHTTTVILPCGVHSLPSKGEPYSLVQRWKTGGSCDCGGWDPGCRYEILSGHHKSSLISFSSMDQFSLFHQGYTQEKQTAFVLAPFKDGIYSVEFDPSISVLQAFSTCIAVLDSRKVMKSSEGGGSGGGILSEPRSSTETTHSVSNIAFSPFGRV